ncbi:hypothetical protein AOL_s00004g519 [Orbilia oligospora ATCC 24927]|uniref:Uncharacterized protein n=1 Tax=Arthrobotrys oligospora (strain ATCC 24927 / CBS 115.81 / DSM 1491) TaxID=756982 RepID=G1WZ08_ARTOA|nr:hypothetical protein AOL_s00004g519 [Orbilia oligospora ATCC 24927]EGX53860.1 hypothetical protein AOL_s00004g519 [Orbilia oligospora ATCC 24927]
MSFNLHRYLKKYPFVDYSAKNWVVHLKESKSQACFDKTTVQSILTLCDSSTPRSKTWFIIYWTSTNTDFPESFTTLMILSYFGIAPVVEVFLEWNYDIDLDERDDKYKRSALSWAAGNGFDAVVTRLLRGPRWKGLVYLPFRYGGANIDSVDRQGRTPLVHAILNKQEPVANLLLRAGAQTNLKDCIGGTPLHYAICSGQNNLVAQMLKKGGKVGLENDTRKELFFSAARSDDNDIIELLLEEGEIDPNERDSNGNTVLLLAVRNGSKKLVQLLLHRGAGPSVEIQNSDFSTPLGLAMEHGYKEIAELLLDTDANFDIKHRGSTPLIMAAKRSNREMVKLLLDRGANPNAKEGHGWTPLIVVAQIQIQRGGYHGDAPLIIATEQLNVEMVKLLLDNGANPNTKGGYNGAYPNAKLAKGGYRHCDTSLIVATKLSDEGIVRLLLANDADIGTSANGWDDVTALMVASAYRRSRSIVEVLLNRGADVEVKDPGGETALSWAVRMEKQDIIQLLVKHGADKTVVNHEGKTPLTYALESKNRRVLQLLVEGDDRYNDLLSELPEGSEE